jgi:hypothetical protein
LRPQRGRWATPYLSDDNYHHTVFGPTNVAIHRVTVEQETRELSEVLQLADEIDITRIPSLGRQTEHLYQLTRSYECKGNDTAVFVHLLKAERLCPEDMKIFQRSYIARNLVTTLVKRAKPSYAADVHEFAARIGLLS